LDEGHRNSQRERNLVNHLWKTFKFNNDATLNPLLWNQYKIARNIYTKMRRKQKRQYYENKIDLCKGDSKAMWSTLKVITSTAPRDTEVIQDIQFDPSLNNLLLPHKFNHFYVNSIKEIEKSLPIDPRYDVFKNLSDSSHNKNCTLHTFKPITLEELKDIVYHLSNVSS
jgi:hypothetical protein